MKMILMNKTIKQIKNQWKIKLRMRMMLLIIQIILIIEFYFIV